MNNEIELKYISTALVEQTQERKTEVFANPEFVQKMIGEINAAVADLPAGDLEYRQGPEADRKQCLQGGPNKNLYRQTRQRTGGRT